MNRDKILIVGDSALTKEEMSDLVDSKESITTRLAKDYNTALNLFKNETPDLLICDLHLYNKSGIDLIAYARTIKNVPVIFIASQNDDAVLDKALCANPEAFLIKPFSPIQLFITIKRVLHQYKSFTSSNTLKSTFNNESLFEQKPTVRELEVIHHLAKGETTKLIADRLCISYTTVQTHRKNLLNKYRAKSCAELVNIACQNNWINLAG